TSKPETYRITFETGIGRAPEPLSAGYGDEIELPSLSESGYVFEGWKAGGRLITDGRLTVTGSLTLVAEWSAVTAPLKLEYGIYEGNYYLSIDSEALSGSDSLREALHRLLTDGCRKRSYRQAYDDLETTDCYDGAFVECLYTGMKMDPDAHGYWNREHVWAKSHGFPSEDCPAFSDLHHLRATEGTVNSARGNSYFAVVTSPTDSDSYGNRWTDSAFEPRDEVKGDVARMMFYMVVRYEGAKEDGYLDLELTDNVGRASAQTETADPDGITRACFGLLSTLIRWSFEDPVDSKEIARNEAVYSLQKNRNPFIDYPELVWYLYPGECASLGYAREDLGDLISFRLKDDAAIARVQNLIDGISGAADKKTAVEAARAAFDALTYESRCFVRNYAALAEAEKELENQGGGEAFFDFTALGGAREGTMTAGGVTVRYRSSSDNAPNSYGLYSQQGKNVVLTVEHADGVTSMTLTMDSNKGDGMSGTVTVTDGKKTVSAEYILFRNAPDDCVLDVSALDGSRTWTVTVASGSSWRIRSVSFAR
ncbi:MAG: endonuclease, partial [Clostridia bacterium]|nr:endonuclease [Clostridia bacterium]